MARVKKSIFDILRHNESYSRILEGAYVLDLFCGSGGMGLGALSHGARHIFMIDIDVTTADKNSYPFKNSVTVIRADGNNLPSSVKSCNLAFIDPPYHKFDYKKILHDLVRTNWVKHGSLVVLEVSSKENCKDFPEYQLMDERRYGKVKLLILRRMAYHLHELRQLILDKFDDAQVSVEDMVGDNNHFHLIVSSSQFKGKNMLEQHRMVYSALEGKVGEEIHALKLKTIIKD